LRVLYVAPDTGNSNITDRQQRLLTDISSTGLNVTAVLGKVSVSQIVQQLRGGQYDILFLVAHGYPNGILLTQTAPNLPNEELTPAHLSSVARYGLKLVVLLACDSVTVGNMVVTSAQVDTICTVTQLDTDTAYLTGSLLAQGLADGLSTRDAFEKARPGNDVDYVYLAARHIELDSKLTGLDTLQSATIQEQARRLDDHGKRLDGHERRIDTLENRGRIVIGPENVIIGMAFLLLVMMIVFAFLAGRG
jgi:hypothetical protein